MIKCFLAANLAALCFLLFPTLKPSTMNVGDCFQEDHQVFKITSKGKYSVVWRNLEDSSWIGTTPIQKVSILLDRKLIFISDCEIPVPAKGDKK